jgi:two-component system LytT family response regulator
METVLNPAVFVRIHRSYIINIRFADEIYKDVYRSFVKMSNNQDIAIGRNYIPRLKRFIF